MCRIAGIINKSLPVELIQSQVKDMCRILKNGGPDDEGFYTSEQHHLVLGNRRLALLDLSQAGHQPMSFDNGRYQITYNGELYNFPQLKAELIKSGFTFRSNSDTEVILAAFSAWGTNAFEKFNGMFAFALFDVKESEIYLVRDASGIKPLYYSVSDKQLIFASEVRAFKPVTGLQEQHEHWQVYLMAYGHLPEPVTTLKHVKPLTKGTYLKYKIAEGSWSTSMFAKFTYEEQFSGRQNAIEQVKTCLTSAVKRHLISDAPIGVFLSGGLDSSITALLANDKSNNHLNTLSLYFAEGQYSEKRYQEIYSVIDKASLSLSHILIWETERKKIIYYVLFPKY
jgi:asparagine synthase (glutamine-hydrolysing)